MTEPDQPLRVDWQQIIEDLRGSGLSVEALTDDPRYSEGEALLDLWRARMVPPVPVKPGRVRTRRVEARPQRMKGPSRLW